MFSDLMCPLPAICVLYVDAGSERCVLSCNYGCGFGCTFRYTTFMTHLDDIISGATDESTSASNLLRKVLIVGHRLKADQIIGWVKSELEGYPAPAELPTYRKGLVVPVKGVWGNYAVQQSRYLDTAGLPKEIQKPLFTVDLRQPIRTLEAWISDDSKSLAEPWRSEAIALYRRLVKEEKVSRYEGLTFDEAYKEIPLPTVRGVIDSVRTKTLELALDLQNVNPDAGESTAAASTVQNDKGIANVVNNFEITIFGDGANVSYGDNAIQTTTVSHGDTEGFIKALRALGIDGRALKELEEAAETLDSERPSRIKQVLERVKSGAISIGTTAATKAVISQVEQLARQFLGN